MIKHEFLLQLGPFAVVVVRVELSSAEVVAALNASVWESFCYDTPGSFKLRIKVLLRFGAERYQILLCLIVNCYIVTD